MSYGCSDQTVETEDKWGRNPGTLNAFSSQSKLSKPSQI
jgi:hypothetical protein